MVAELIFSSKIDVNPDPRRRYIRFGVFYCLECLEEKLELRNGLCWGCEQLIGQCRKVA